LGLLLSVASEEDATRTESRQDTQRVVVGLREEPDWRWSYDIYVSSSTVLAVGFQAWLPGRRTLAQIVLYFGSVKRFMVDRE
jgi:hypothetical protein